MTTDVLYVTYERDAEWFRWSLKVLRKNLTGYQDIHVVCPAQDDGLISRVVIEETDERPSHHTIVIHPIPDWKGQGYHWQQWVKMNADTYTDADLIFHCDSDAFLGKPVSVEDFLTEGKPSWLWSYYSDFKGEVPWKAPTERATGLKCDQEFMQAFPFVLHRSTYQRARDLMHAQHGVSLETYIREAAGRGHNSFSEFNFLGRMAWEYEHEKYAWIDRNRDERGNLTTSHWPVGFYASRQFWSRAPFSDHLAEIQAMLGAEKDPMSTRFTKMGHRIPSEDTHIGKWVEEAGRLDCDGYLLPRILKYIKPGDVVIDVGANIGDHTEGYAKKVRGKDSGRVLAFEPNPLAFTCLKTNMEGHGHVECINKGLSNLPGKAAMVQSPNVGASHMIAGDDVEVTTLDSYGLEKCDLIKVDAEGFEYAILQGAWETITKCRPIIVMEINRGALGRNGVLPEDIYHWFLLRGYRVHHAEDGPQFDVFCIPE